MVEFLCLAPVLGLGALSSVVEPPCMEHWVLLTHCVHTAVHGLLNLCWNNPHENQHLFSACSVLCALLDTPEEVPLLFCFADGETAV